MEYKETEDSECQLCNEIEDDDHPFKCNDPTMQDAQEEGLEILKTSLTKIHTSTTITSTIITHLRQWMRNSELPPSQSLHPDIKYHQDIQKAIHQQNKIGWDHFIRGRILGKWQVAQKLFLKTKYRSRWPILCIKSIKDASQKVWEIRNLLKFGTKPQVYTNHQKRLQPTIKSYYATFRQTVSRTQYKLFSVPLQIRYNFSPQENRQWINSVKMARKLFKRREKEFYKNFHPITKYFHPISKPQV
jgi:hypothetical protein